VNIAQAIKRLHPDLESLIDFEVMDNGEGQFISEWKNESVSQPTEAELQTAWGECLANPTPPPKSETQILGEQVVAKDIEIMELQSLNDTLGEQVVDHDVRLMIGGL
jgi:hypothetical protein